MGSAQAKVHQSLPVQSAIETNPSPAPKLLPGRRCPCGSADRNPRATTELFSPTPVRSRAGARIETRSLQTQIGGNAASLPVQTRIETIEFSKGSPSVTLYHCRPAGARIETRTARL